MISVSFTRLSKLFFGVKKSSYKLFVGCSLFLDFWFHFCNSVPFEKVNIIRLESYS